MMDAAPLWQFRISVWGLADIKRQNPSGKPGEGMRHQLCNALTSLEPLCQKMQMTDLYIQIGNEKHRLEHGATSYAQDENFSSIEKSFSIILTQISAQLDLRHFAYVPTEKTKYFEQQKLFDEAVYNNFPKARDDIKCAGNCRAADLHAAAIYHLMCVVNIGLITIARHLRVTIKKTPLEYAEWKPMIDKLEIKMKQKTVRPPGNKMEQAKTREFYNGILAELKFFKDMRNDVMHARSNYIEPEVENAYIRVRDFMMRLADGGISESV